MAYKRTTKKTGRNTRSSVTYSTNGPTTYSSSSSHAGTTYTHTSRDGKYYTTRTERTPEGFVTRKRIYSSTSKAKKEKVQPLNAFGVLIFLIIVIISSIFS